MEGSEIINNSVDEMRTLCNSFCSLLNINERVVAGLTLSVDTGSKLSLDWPYHPLLSLYHSSSSQESQVSPHMIRHTLSWLLLLPRPPAPPTQTWSYLATVLLCPGSLYLSPDISSVLHLNLVSTLTRGNIDLSLDIPGADITLFMSFTN